MMRWFDGLRLFQNQSHLLLRPRVIQFTNRDAAVDYGIPTGRVKAERWATPKKGSERGREGIAVYKTGTTHCEKITNEPSCGS